MCEADGSSLGWAGTLEIINLNYPECLGFKQKGVFLCVETESEACIPIFLDGVDKRGYDTSKHKILLQRGTTSCIIPPILNGGPLCKGITTCCCFEERISCPCDDEVPCMYGCCFIICFQRFAWDLKVFEVTAPEVKMSLALTHSGPSGAPETAEMQR